MFVNIDIKILRSQHHAEWESLRILHMLLCGRNKIEIPIGSSRPHITERNAASLREKEHMDKRTMKCCWEHCRAGFGIAVVSRGALRQTGLPERALASSPAVHQGNWPQLYHHRRDKWQHCDSPATASQQLQ